MVDKENETSSTKRLIQYIDRGDDSHDAGAGHNTGGDGGDFNGSQCRWFGGRRFGRERKFAGGDFREIAQMYCEIVTEATSQQLLIG